ncbi:hypothetical protein AKO1_011228 [Acrasis kona]|uniref:Guided entry of tail-anchored proteins factor 1 n=1 Tax=Acrasis kona TaxID=1008807 RepID=A0AAW2YWX9_9EUKA
MEVAQQTSVHYQLCLLLPLALIITHFIASLWNRYISNFLTYRANHLQSQIQKLRLAMIKYNSPSTFTEYAKINRRVLELDKELSKIKSTRSYYIRLVIGYCGSHLFEYGLFVFSAIIWRGITVFEFGPAWTLWPISNSSVGVNIGATTYLMISKVVLSTIGL